MTDEFLPPLPPLPPNQEFNTTGQQKTNIGSGPFGLVKGLHIDDIPGQIQEIGSCLYKADTLPKNHSAFEYYILKITPVQGLSWIKAIGSTINTNPYGVELQSAFNEMKMKLEKTYGKSERVDFLMHESIWSEPRDWMQAVLNGERYLAARWENPKSQLPSSLDLIFLHVAAVDTYSGLIAIEYSFDNHMSAEQELAMLEDDAL